MITKKQKQVIVDKLIEELKGVQGLYMIDYTGMKVEDDIKLRRALKAIDVKFKVTKNSLLKRAIDEVGGFPIPSEKYIGPTGLVMSYDDPTSPAKIIKEQSEKTKIPVLKAALIEGQFYDGSMLKELAALPGKLDLIASIIGSVHAPISGIVGTINAVLRDVAYLVEEVAKKKAS